MRSRAILLLSLLPLLPVVVAASSPLENDASRRSADRVAAAADDGDALVFITVHYRSRTQLRDITSRFQHVLVDRKARTVQVEASHTEYLALRRAGMAVEIDEAATAHMRRAEAAMQSALRARRTGTQSQGTQSQNTLSQHTPSQQSSVPALKSVTAESSIPSYTCYRTVEETYATMDQLAASHPDLARVIDIGPSWLASVDPAAGYRMRVLRLGNAATDAALPDKPAMVVFASIHAREYTPAELLTRFAEDLINGYGSDPEATWLLDNFRFHLVLQANPDGRKKAESGLSWRKNVDDRNGVCSNTAYGIDLNRNFPYRWNSNSEGSSDNACASMYHGPAQLSEPETRNLLRYVAGAPDTRGVYRGGVLPDRRGDAADSAAPDDYRGLFLDLHSYSRVVLWPWSFTSANAANAGPLRTLGRRLAWFNGYTPKQWTGLYAADGTDTDTMYGLLGVPSYTIEFGVSFFEDCPTFESTTLPRNLAALRYAARNLQAPYSSPAGPDTTAISAFPAFVVPGKPVTITATVDDGTFNQSNGSEPVQAIAAVSSFLDRTPWASAAMPMPMAAVDGRFDSSREIVQTTIATGRLSPGRHVVYVRGTDAGGTPGTPQAVYFTVATVRAMKSVAASAPRRMPAALP